MMMTMMMTAWRAAAAMGERSLRLLLRVLRWNLRRASTTLWLLLLPAWLWIHLSWMQLNPCEPPCASSQLAGRLPSPEVRLLLLLPIPLLQLSPALLCFVQLAMISLRRSDPSCLSLLVEARQLLVAVLQVASLTFSAVHARVLLWSGLLASQARLLQRSRFQRC